MLTTLVYTGNATLRPSPRLYRIFTIQVNRKHFVAHTHTQREKADGKSIWQIAKVMSEF